MAKLVSDAVGKDTVVKYVVTVDGVASDSVPEVVDESSVRLVFDLNEVSAGAHSISVVAENSWGVSNPVGFTFTSEKPADPTGLRIEF